MSKLTALALLFVFLSVAAVAQTRVIGKVADTAEKKKLSLSSVLLLRKSDSMLVRHVRTGKEGDFQLKGVPKGQYLLMVTYPTYADYIDDLEIKDTGTLTLSPIPMVLKSKLLEAVVVSSNKGAIRIKGDTTEFNADSFRTQAGATVEDLLKKLPGIQVDKDGKITAQGQSVQKVLVDGEEFFGDDPTLVTQNFRADMIDKVQVFDKKSDQATFTGIDDGQTQKTINLKLKDSKKNGYFGRVNAGAGTDGYYDAQLMINAFRKKEKISGYGIISNTGKVGLNWNERDNYGQSFLAGADVDENNGFISISSNGDDLDSWDGRFGGQGKPAVKTGGLHYNNKWADDNQSINGNYKFMQLNVTGNSTTNSQYILPDTFYYNNQRQAFNNQITRHSFSGIYEAKFDTTSSIKLMADGGTDHKVTQNHYNSEYLASDSSMVNSNNREVSNIGDNRVVNSNLLWRKKLGKVGRTLSFNLRENYTNNTSSGYLNSTTKYAVLPDSVIDQYKTYHSDNLLFDSRLTYTEPLSRTSFLIGNYGAVINNSHSDRSSFNRSSDGKYHSLDSLYSNDYQYNVLTQRGGLAYSLVKKKIRFNIGNDIGATSYTQRDLRADTAVKRKFINWYPQASLNYNFSNQKAVHLQYNGSTIQPTVSQIQPILNNEDPLNITIGNPGLKPQFRNSISAWYNDYNVLSERSIWTNAYYAFTENAIALYSVIDPTGKKTNQYVNVNGNYSGNLYFSYNRKVRAINMWTGASTSISISNNVGFVNGLHNETHNNSYRFGIDLTKSKEKKYEIGFHPTATYTTSQSTINTGVVTNYWTYSLNGEGDLFLPLKFQIHGEVNASLRQKTAVFANNNNVVLVNGWIGKKFMKNDALVFKIMANDLLNQNIGFQRTVNSNFITQNTYNTIQRYFMFSILWNFTKPGTPAPPNRD